MNDKNHDPREILRVPDQYLDSAQRQWFAPLSATQKAMQHCLYVLNKCVVRTVFRLHTVGLRHLPPKPPFVLAPNHTSSLDGAALAGALPWHVLRQTRWAGRRGAVLATPWRRQLNRLAQTIPVDIDLTALAVAALVLRNGKNLVWFPEGRRTRTGELQPFKPGLGMLLTKYDVPVVPAWIQGAFEALPPSRSVPRPVRISVRVGPPLRFSDSHTGNTTAEPTSAQIDRFTRLLRARVLALSQPET